MIIYLPLGIESAITGTQVPARKDETFESTGALNYDPSFTVASASCISRPPPSHSSFPPRAAYNLNHHLLTTHIPEDDMDDLPLPPPPEDLDTCPLPMQFLTTREPQALSRHANVMQSLNEKLSMQKSMAQTSVNLQRSTSVEQHGAPSHRVVLRSTQRAQETTSEDVTSDSGSFDHQIRRGVKLRHTICNDRSAPRVIRHQTSVYEIVCVFRIQLFECFQTLIISSHMVSHATHWKLVSGKLQDYLFSRLGYFCEEANSFLKYYQSCIVGERGEQVKIMISRENSNFRNDCCN